MSRSNAKAAAERLKNQASEAAKATEVEESAESDTEESTQNPETNSSDSVGTSADEAIDPSASNESEITGKDDSNQSIEEKAAKLVKVEFVGPYKRYSKGDIASFSADIAVDLIKKRAAVIPGEAIEPELEPV